jgi:uncharacterized membrane protein YbhN (UPF0104 family)
MRSAPYAGWLLRVSCLLAGAAALAVAARHVDWPAARQSLRAIGPAAPLLLAPALLAATCDAIAWRASFESMHAMAVGRLWRVRVAADAVFNSLPGGPALGEGLRIVLLTRCFGLTVADSVANVAITKLAVAVAQACFLLCGVAAVSGDLATHSVELTGREGLHHWALWGAGSLLLAYLGLGTAIASGLVRASLEGLGRMAPPALRERLKRVEAPLARIDHGLRVARRLRWSRVVATIAMFFAAYVCFAFEDWLILHLLGADVTFARSLSMTAIVSMVRVLFFFVPSGIGAQELGYYALLKAYGIADAEAIAAAFSLVKRCRELAWIGLGYVLLAGLPARVTELRTAEGGSATSTTPGSAS